MKSIGPNTNASAELIHGDCLLLVGEDAACTEALLADSFGPILQQHAFRGYVFQRRSAITTLFSGMGTGCLEPLIWELGLSRRVQRLLLVGTAGLLESGKPQLGHAYVIRQGRAMGTGVDAIGLKQAFEPRWPIAPGAGVETASAVSTEFYYGFSKTILAARHPLAATALQEMYRIAAKEDLVDMEVAQFYALCSLLLEEDIRFLAIKSPANPAGVGAEHLQNTPHALAACLELAVKLLGTGATRGASSPTAVILRD